VTSPPQPDSFDVFLSYHSADADWVGMLRSRLASKGIRVWLDSEQIRPGDLFPGTLARAINSVRCVVLVLSPGSAASAWVEEEFTLALAQRRQVIGALIDDVEPPGFLGGRTWVDFRDEAQFDAALDQLVFGITGHRQPGALAAPAPGYRDEPSAHPATDECEVLKRLIDRRRHDARRLWRARAASGVVGVGIGGGFLLAASDTAFIVRAAVGGCAPLILALAAWGVTAPSLTRLDHKVEQFEVLRDGLEACRSRSHPGCKRLRQRFWDMIANVAADATARPV
jgi:hypothetical protein